MISRELRLRIEVEAQDAEDYRFLARWATQKAEELTPKRSSQEWCDLLGYFILDPDGWDRKNFWFSWNEEITEEEFLKRAHASTHRPPAH